MRPPKLEKIDLVKAHIDLYTATLKIKEVNSGKATFLSAEGQGEPGGPAFQSAIEKLYSVAYTTKFMLKNSGTLDFAIGRLECLWFGEDFEHTPKSDWRWRMLIRIPDRVTEKHLQRARGEVRKRRDIDATEVKRWTWTEGRCVQIMHIGPYDGIGRAYRELDEFARAKGLATSCPGHEIYISDPRRTVPVKLKTIARLPVRKGR